MKTLDMYFKDIELYHDNEIIKTHQVGVDTIG